MKKTRERIVYYIKLSRDKEGQPVMTEEKESEGLGWLAIIWIIFVAIVAFGLFFQNKLPDWMTDRPIPYHPNVLENN